MLAQQASKLHEQQSLSRTALKALVRARRRTTAYLLGKLPSDVCDTLLAVASDPVTKDTTTDAISHRTLTGLSDPSLALKESGYRQIAVQLSEPGRVENFEEFLLPSNPGLMARVEAILGPVMRCRIGELPVRAQLDWHIDPGEQNRFIALIEGDHCFEIDVDGAVETIDMARGEVWFVNTAWPHRVTNIGNRNRFALLGMLPEAPA